MKGLLLLTLLLALVGCGSGSRPASEPAADAFNVGLVFDVGGRGDKSFNDAAYAGLERAEKELGIRFTTLESGEGADREAGMRQLAAGGSKLVFGVGFLFTDDIKQLAGQVGVPFLIHFTRVENLPSIMQHGLYPVARACEVGIEPQRNDLHRLDGHLGATSLSIAFPNYRMFYKHRVENPGTEWVVLGIDPAVLWEKDCAFCRHNAADARISGQALQALKTAASFTSLFDEIDGMQTRAEQQLKSFDPTDGQAEILVFDVIEPALIGGAVFGTAAMRDHYGPLMGNRQIMVHGPKGGYFASRSYVRIRR